MVQDTGSPRVSGNRNTGHFIAVHSHRFPDAITTFSPDATTVRTGLGLTGVKQGASEATISFTVRGVTGRTLTVPVLANTEKVYEKEIALGAPAHSAVDGYPDEEPSRRPVLFRPDQTAPPGLHLM